MDELKGQHTILKDCVEQLTTVESSRANLISHLREVLQEQVSHPIFVYSFHLSVCFCAFAPELVVSWVSSQEYKLDRVRSQLQVNNVFIYIC